MLHALFNSSEAGPEAGGCDISQSYTESSVFNEKDKKRILANAEDVVSRLNPSCFHERKALALLK